MRSNTRMKNSFDREIERELDDLRSGLDILDLNYNDAILQKFQIYLDVLYEKRSTLHLLSHQDYKHIAKRHFLTSLMAFDHIKGHSIVCNIGAGAGFPSMPLKIMEPRIDVTLIESKIKKAEFLRFLTKRLGCHDITIVNRRVEDYRDKTFEIILLKAVGMIKDLIDSVDNLLKPGGKAIFYKTHQVDNELNNIILKGFNVNIEKIFTPLEEKPLALVILSKDR